MKEFDFKSGEIILVDKPLHWTSFDVVNKIRWNLKKLYKVKKIKVGHAGTLDPLATGLLIICTGQKTKISQDLTSEDKTYTGTFLLGKTTPSFDLETPFDKDYPTDHLTKELVESTAEGFLGEQLQVPPIFSAKKIDGKRAYESAREGKEVEMRKNLIDIKEFSVDCSDFPQVHFQISCSKGTYIRSIANDFGEKLGSGACLIALRRIQSGAYRIEDAKPVDEWIDIISSLNSVN
ncbi:MAG: tRNA pseudouridine(55) synthase TruB [Brumimicrobium sp.]|nr:tRNA pseudouridine(55) synthase TruB [Brumimicrobium sp.]